MKTRNWKHYLIALGAVLTLALAVAAATPSIVAAAVATDNLTASEVAALSYMREEEKLAHDVYMEMYDIWGLSLFKNIAASEQSHTDAILTLLERYDVADPAAGKAAGEFTDATLQGLYGQLVAQGAQSLADALKVGAAIEEIDIFDLEERTADIDNTDILTVFDNLTRGSRNHLRSFTRTLERQTGEVYEPQYMDIEAYEAVVGGTSERGGSANGRATTSGRSTVGQRSNRRGGANN